MEPIRIGVIKEGKVPPDFRTPLTPNQCKVLKTMYPHAEVVVQSSPIRTFADQEYRDHGVEVVEDLSDCDIILGVKEVPIPALIPGKTFMFFSHTIKKQPYNRELLRALLDQKIRLIDYEVIKDKYRSRLIGFGRYAGIVGCYNGFLTYGLKHGTYSLKPAHACHDRKEVEEELSKVVLPKNFRCLVTGFGRVGHGAQEIIDLLPHREPMLLINELTNIKKLFSATAIVNVRKDSFFVQGHFPQNPVMPGVLIVESFGQAAAALTAYGLDKSTYENKLVFLMGVEKARFRNPVIPDCDLILKIEAIRSHGRVWKYKGEAFVDDKKMADAIWSATIVDKK